MFAYDPEGHGNDEAGYSFGVHKFVPGEYVSISGKDGKAHTFRVASVRPFILSIQLVKSFGLEVTL
jgi:hypothetical protein